MPTNRTRRARSQRGQIPAWMALYQATGEKPIKGSEDHQEWTNWFLLSGYGTSKGWPEPPPPTIPEWWPEDAKRAERARRGEPEPE